VARGACRCKSDSQNKWIRLAMSAVLSRTPSRGINFGLVRRRTLCSRLNRKRGSSASLGTNVPTIGPVRLSLPTTIRYLRSPSTLQHSSTSQCKSNTRRRCRQHFPIHSLIRQACLMKNYVGGYEDLRGKEPLSTQF
jgi:hypothetical protein